VTIASHRVTVARHRVMIACHSLDLIGGSGVQAWRASERAKAAAA